MATVFDVAKYITRSLQSVTTMKLQKLAYYCQAYHLAWHEVPLFDEDFEAWANGPVCVPLYEKHKGLFRIDESFFAEYGDYEFDDDEKDTMDSIIEHYGNKTPEWLSQLTHMERPWKEARGNTPLGDPCKTVITKESLLFYYGGLARGEE